MRTIKDTNIYLERMAKPLGEKLKIVKYFPKNAVKILDVGCSDGTVTAEMAKLFPNVNFLGIDLNEDFIKSAKEKHSNLENLSFERVYLRELLARQERFDAVVFCSVLHEFFTYGEGISSVLKALADAHELLVDKGVVIIRDMILNDYSKTATLQVGGMLRKILANKSIAQQREDFEKYFGRLNSIYRLNHFLLKYLYKENWDREGKEFYVPVTFEEYSNIFTLLGMRLQYQESYLIHFLRDKWIADFGFSEEELAPLRSTGILVAQKIIRHY